jgi:hypothetical protein
LTVSGTLKIKVINHSTTIFKHDLSVLKKATQKWTTKVKSKNPVKGKQQQEKITTLV